MASPCRGAWEHADEYMGLNPLIQARRDTARATVWSNMESFTILADCPMALRAVEATTRASENGACAL
jgi:hypothetical protein